MTMVDTPVNTDPPRNPATGLLAGILNAILAEVGRVRSLLETKRVAQTLHHTPIRAPLELHVHTWIINPAAANTLALMVGTTRVAVVVVPANGSVSVELPITIAGGQDIFVVNNVTGARVDGDPAVLADSYLVADIGGSGK